MVIDCLLGHLASVLWVPFDITKLPGLGFAQKSNMQWCPFGVLVSY